MSDKPLEDYFAEMLSGEPATETENNSPDPESSKEDEERWEREIERDWQQAIRDCKDM